MFRTQLLSVIAVGAVAQAAAFAKMWLIARYFGVGVELDAYNLAFVPPALISGIIGGAVQTGLFPVCSRVIVERGEAALQPLQRWLFWSIAAAGIAVSCIVFAFAGWIAGAITAQGEASLQSFTEYVLRFAAFAIALNAAGDFLGGLLALRGRFLIAAAAPIANSTIGALLLVAWPEGRLTNLTLGTLLGTLAQMCIVWFGVRNSGLQLVGALPAWSSVQAELSEFLRLGAWILPGTVFSNVANALPPVLLVSFGTGAVSAFGYAFRIHQTAVQLLIMTASPVLLARFSELVARRELEALERLQRKARWASAAVGAAGFAVVAVLGQSLLMWILGYGEFDADAAERVAKHWLWLTLGLGFAIYGNILAKRLQADRHALVLSAFSLASGLALALAAWALRPVMGELAVPAAVVTAAVIPTLGMEWFLLLIRGRHR